MTNGTIAAKAAYDGAIVDENNHLMESLVSSRFYSARRKRRGGDVPQFNGMTRSESRTYVVEGDVEGI